MAHAMYSRSRRRRRGKKMKYRHYRKKRRGGQFRKEVGATTAVVKKCLQDAKFKQQLGKAAVSGLESGARRLFGRFFGSKKKAKAKPKAVPGPPALIA